MSTPNFFSQKLHGKRALVFGGSSGLGFAVASILLQSGVNVTITSSGHSKVSNAVSRLGELSPSAASEGRIHGEVFNLGARDTLVTDLEQFFGHVFREQKLDHLIYTAGDDLSAYLGPPDTYSYSKIIDAGHIRFVAPLLVAKVGAKSLNSSVESSMTFTAAGLTQVSRPGWAISASYAFAMLGMIRSLAGEFAPIRVNCVSPGPTDTEMHGSGEKVEEWKKAAGRELLTGTVARPEDVAESYLACIRDYNMTGNEVVSVGGWGLHGGAWGKP